MLQLQTKKPKKQYYCTSKKQRSCMQMMQLQIVNANFR